MIYFNEEEIELMNECDLNFDFNNLTDDELIRIEEVIGDRLDLSELDRDYNPTEKGLICYSILDKLSEE